MIVYDDRGGEKILANRLSVDKFGKLNHFIGSLH